MNSDSSDTDSPPTNCQAPANVTENDPSPQISLYKNPSCDVTDAASTDRPSSQRSISRDVRSGFITEVRQVSQTDVTDTVMTNLSH